MADTFDPQPVPTVRQRPAPSGSWPPGTKLWGMAAAALALLAIIWFSGPATTGTSPRAATAPTAVPPTPPEAVRSLQQRLDEQARRVPPPQPVALVDQEPARTGTSYAGAASSPDDGHAERRRHEDDSLRASNVVESARQPPTAARSEPPGSPFPPSTADLAALMRALRPDTPATGVEQTAVPAVVAPRPAVREATAPPVIAQTPAGPLYLLAEGRHIETTLLNRINGDTAAPVNVLVTSAAFAADHQTVLVPVGSRILGKSTAVQAFGQSRLAITFHRLQMPDGTSFSLDAPALNQIGEGGLKDRVNSHFLSTLAASAAVGVVSGLAQSASGGGYGRSADNGSTIVVTSTSDAVAQATAQTMSRYLNRLPEVTVREGHGVNVYLTADLQLPAYHPVLR